MESTIMNNYLNLNGLPIHVTQICILECPRRILKTIIGLGKGIEFELKENYFLLAGNILHSILQDSFKFNFGKIEYYYCNKGLNLEDALYTVFSQAYERWRMLFNIQFPSALWVEYPDSIAKVDEYCGKQLNSLAKASETLITVENGKLQSLLLGEEFQVSYKLRSGVIITGRIDLFVRTKKPKRYRIIELKTGGRPRESDKTQIKLYGEIFSKSYPNYEFELELWYTQKKRAIIRKIDLDENQSNLSVIEDLITQSMTIKSIADLPPSGDPFGWCRYPHTCSICEKEWEIFEIADY